MELSGLSGFECRDIPGACPFESRAVSVDSPGGRELLPKLREVATFEELTLELGQVRW